MDQVIVLGRDPVGTVAESDGMRYYLTDCCGASAKGSTGGTVCRSCYQPISDELGDVPDKELVYRDGGLAFIDKPMELVEVYGDGISYDEWKRRVGV